MTVNGLVVCSGSHACVATICACMCVFVFRAVSGIWGHVY